MSKKAVCSVSLKVPAGKVTPSPGIASVLGQRGVNLMKFCKDCSERTSNGFESGEMIFVSVDIFADKSFDIVVKGASVSQMLLKFVGVEKGSSTPGKSFVGDLGMSKIIEIAEKKLPFMNVYDLPEAIDVVKGTARSIGIRVQED